MAYPPDMKDAANRHYRDGKKLFDSKSFNNAGYHFGFAAECATKHRMLLAGVREDDPAIWLHFKKLRVAALLAISTRSDVSLFTALSSAAFMQDWDTKMRYTSTSAISQDRAEKWRGEADTLMGLLV